MYNKLKVRADLVKRTREAKEKYEREHQKSLELMQRKSLKDVNTMLIDRLLIDQLHKTDEYRKKYMDLKRELDKQMSEVPLLVE